MNRKTCKVLCCVAVVSCCSVCFGCTEAPSEVQEEISRLDEVQDSLPPDADVVITNENFLTMDAIRTDAKQVMEANSGNVKIESLSLPQADTLHTHALTAREVSNLQQRLVDVNEVLHFVEPFSADSPLIETYQNTEPLESWSEGDDEPVDLTDLHLKNSICHTSYTPKESDVGQYISVGWGGGMSFSRGFDMIVSPYNLEDNRIVETCAPDQWGDTAYTMYDGTEWKLADAAQYVQDVLGALYPDDWFTYTPEYVDVREIVDRAGTHGYWFFMKRVAPDGIEIMPLYEMVDQESNALDNFLICESAWVWCVKQDEIQEIRTFDSWDIAETEDVPEVLSLSAAKEILAAKLAQGRTYEVNCRLAYAIRLYGSQVGERIGSSFVDSAVQCHDYESIRMEPYWVFTEQLGSQQVRYCINAQTCEFEIR